VRRKAQAVLRLVRGESLERLSRELGVTAARLSQWRERFLASGEQGLVSREPDVRDEEIARLRAKVGELTMERELLEEKIARLEGGVPLAPGRSRR
jgi:transposase-like protein